jgi:hypothetical protein
MLGDLHPPKSSVGYARKWLGSFNYLGLCLWLPFHSLSFFLLDLPPCFPSDCPFLFFQSPGKPPDMLARERTPACVGTEAERTLRYLRLRPDDDMRQLTLSWSRTTPTVGPRGPQHRVAPTLTPSG